MNLKKLIVEGKDRFKTLDTENEDQRALLKRKLNEGYKRVYRAHPWEYRKKTGELIIPPVYKTGTCSVVKFTGSNLSAARTVTLSTPLDSSYIGWFFQPQGGNNWHRILDVDGSTLTLESPIVDVPTASGLTLKIWKRFCYVYSEVDSVLTFGKWGPTESLTYRSPFDSFDDKGNTLSDEIGSYSEFGMDNFVDTYSTGKVSISADSDVMTGVGTAWLTNLGPGDIIIIGDDEYRVKRVISDTEAILYNHANSAVEDQPYSAQKDTPIGFEFINEGTNYIMLPYTYLAKGFNMVHETLDRPLLPEAFDMCIVDYAEVQRSKENAEADWTTKQATAQLTLDGLKAKHRVVQPRFQQFKTKIPAGIRR